MRVACKAINFHLNQSFVAPKSFGKLKHPALTKNSQKLAVVHQSHFPNLREFTTLAAQQVTTQQQICATGLC